MLSFIGGMVLARIFIPSGDTVTGEELAGDTMASWCSGAAPTSTSTRMRLLSIYGVSREEVVFDSGSNRETPSQTLDFVSFRKIQVPSQSGIKSALLRRRHRPLAML